MSPVTADEDLYPLHDMHDQFVKYSDREEINRFLREGVAKSFGTKKKVLGYKLTVTLARIAEDYLGRSLVPANFAGTRYIFRQKMATENVNSFIYRLKALVVTESPEHALLRMLMPVALESSVYTRPEQATDAEIAKDPGKLRRQEVAEIFRAPRAATGICRRRMSDDDQAPVRLSTMIPLGPSRTAGVVMPFPSVQSPGDLALAA